MKILWFTNTPACYAEIENGYNGGGWISSLEKEVRKVEAVELAISFFYTETKKSVNDNVVYYPISLRRSFADKLKDHLLNKTFNKAEIALCLNVIEDFKPDIIHVFGSEQTFGLIKEYTNIPMIIHIQGMLNPCLNAYFVPNVGLFEYIRYSSVKEYYQKYRGFKLLKKGAIRERKILSLCNHYMGRTEWDRNVISCFSPSMSYYYCSEVLREPFYKATQWSLRNSRSIKITTTISKVDYKGFDLILKTAQLLKENLHLTFEWDVFGIDNFDFWKRMLKIDPEAVGVNLKGVVDSEVLIDGLQNSDVFVHPSYIDNSPNSVCEAQLLGMPVVATNVGGVSSLIEHNVTGVLVPANDPYTLACKIKELKENTEKALTLAKCAREIAWRRHDVDTIVKRNIEIYKEVLSQ